MSTPRLPEPLREQLLDACADLLLRHLELCPDWTPSPDPPPALPRRPPKGGRRRRLRMNVKPSPKARKLPRLRAIDELTDAKK